MPMRPIRHRAISACSRRGWRRLRRAASRARPGPSPLAPHDQPYSRPPVTLPDAELFSRNRRSSRAVEVMPEQLGNRVAPAASIACQCHPRLGFGPDPAGARGDMFVVIARSSLLPAPPAAHARLDAEIEFLDVLVLQQALAGIVHHDAADFEHVAVVGGLERHVGVLLDEQDGDAALAVDAADDVEDLLHQLRRQAERRLVEQHQPRPRHQRAADRQHLLLAARQRAGALVGALLQHREVAEHASRSWRTPSASRRV